MTQLYPSFKRKLRYKKKYCSDVGKQNVTYKGAKNYLRKFLNYIPDVVNIISVFHICRAWI